MSTKILCDACNRDIKSIQERADLKYLISIPVKDAVEITVYIPEEVQVKFFISLTASMYKDDNNLNPEKIDICMPCIKAAVRKILSETIMRERD